MGNRWISDIREYEGPDGAPSSARKRSLARFLGDIVASGSLLSVGEFQVTATRCRKRPNRSRCPGKLRVGRDAESDNILWACTVCKDRGVITNWQRTHWDLSMDLQRGRIVSLAAERARRASRKATGPFLVYELEVELIHSPIPLDEPVARRIRLSGENTLHELHSCIHKAFERADEEPYEFMFGAPYEPETRRFSGPGIVDGDEEDTWESQTTRLETLSITQGCSFGYLYDFSDEWIHRITVVSSHEVWEQPGPPQVIERFGEAPSQQQHADGDWDEELFWNDIDTTYPMTSIYGPYIAEEGPDPDDWMSMDDLERQLLIAESHDHSLPEDHPPVEAILLHAVVHDLAETHLAQMSKAERRRVITRHPSHLNGRHAVIHDLGKELVLRILEGAGPPKQGRGKHRQLPVLEHVDLSDELE